MSQIKSQSESQANAASSDHKSPLFVLQAALQWHVDHGCGFVWDDQPVNQFNLPDNTGFGAGGGLFGRDKTPLLQRDMPSSAPGQGMKARAVPGHHDSQQPHMPQQGMQPGSQQGPQQGHAAPQAIEAAQKLADAATNLDELRQAIADFDGLSIKKTATNLVFADGNPAASIMFIGEAPEADDDRHGRAFMGKSGDLVDIACHYIGLSRTADQAQASLYFTNILNWRPPGNRSPTQMEIDLSLPFLRRHIALVKPKMIICAGIGPAKYLLGRHETISKMRGSWFDYIANTGDCGDSKGACAPIPAFVMHHPNYILRNPLQKQHFWNDILSIKLAIKLAVQKID